MLFRSTPRSDPAVDELSERLEDGHLEQLGLGTKMTEESRFGDPCREADLLGRRRSVTLLREEFVRRSKRSSSHAGAPSWIRR